MVRKISVVLFFILFLPVSSLPQNISAKASVDKSSYLVGDYINYSIRVVHDKSLNLVPPSIKDSLAGLSVLKIDPPVNKDSNGVSYTSFNYILSGYDSAEINIPPVPIQYKSAGDSAFSTVMTNPLQFLVSTVKINPAAQIKDVKAPIKIPLDWRIVALWILGIIILLLIAYYLYRKYKLKKMLTPKTEKIIKLAPYQIALNSLKELEEKKLWQQGLIKEYHSALTEIIRKYFEDRFDLAALELTTSEALALLKNKNDAAVILDVTKEFLNNADLVKFAKFVPLNSVNEEMLKQAYEIVNKTVESAKPDVPAEVKDVQ